MWYFNKNIRIALRKHVLRIDLHTHVGEVSDFNNPNDLTSSIRSMLSSAIYKGLDIIGIVSHEGPYIGQEAQKLVLQEGIDLYVLAGEEYFTSDRIRMIVFHLKDRMPPNLSAEQAIEYSHKNHGFSLIINISKRQLQQLNKLEGTLSAPDGIEVYDAVSGGFRDVNTDYPNFVGSAAKSSNELDKINVYTLLDRSEAEKIGLLPEHYGEEYTPQYLQ
jgi:hypothetical protein